VATATATSIYVNRSLAFGIGPIASTFMHAGIELLHSRSIKTIALIFEDAAATKDWCKGAADKAKQLNITVVASVQVSQQLNRTEVANALAQFRAASPDAVVGCTYYNVCAEFLKQACPRATLLAWQCVHSGTVRPTSEGRPRVWRGTDSNKFTCLRRQMRRNSTRKLRCLQSASLTLSSNWSWQPLQHTS
jgi:hypothetical protein